MRGRGRSPWRRNAGSAATFVPLSGSSGSYIRTTDKAALDIIGDIDIRWLVKATDWTPALTRALGGKRVGTGNQRSWYSTVTATTGRLNWLYSTDGVTETTKTSTVSPTVADGDPLYVRITHDVDDGAGNHVITFYVGTGRETWTQLGDPVTTAGTIAFFSGTAGLEIGSVNAGTAGSPWAGDVSWFQLRSGIGGTVVAEFDAALLAGGTSYADAYGNTWTYTA